MAQIAETAETVETHDTVLPNAPAPKNSHPSGDNRFKMLEASMKKHQYQPDALIEVLHSAQELFGFLQEDLLIYIANSLRLPPSRVYGVATFYHLFSLKPRARHTCNICLGTACYVKGAAELVAAAESLTGLRMGETSADGEIALENTRCIGPCGIAPAAVLDEEVLGNLDPETIAERMKGWLPHGPK